MVKKGRRSERRMARVRGVYLDRTGTPNRHFQGGEGSRWAVCGSACRPRHSCRGSAPSSARTRQRLDQSSAACHSSPTTPAVGGSSLKQVLQLSRDAPQWRKKASNSLPKLSRQLPGPTATSMGTDSALSRKMRFLQESRLRFNDASFVSV